MRSEERTRPHDGDDDGAAPESPGACAWHREFPGEVSSVPAARTWAHGLLAVRLAPPALDDVLLLLSEVVTNAVTHSDSGRTADGRVTVHVTCDPGAVHVEVTDDGSATSTPVVHVPDPEADGGRGLWLVDLLAAAWGFRHDGMGRSVWFQVAG
ncbi:ATP-binding protein [Streptosporangium lutulentum]|uniref:Anti-sigma regulatory factor (Ser/Thr protein kinase) n=1 Tax=Streptosporangium lutulentum TaxID=1461250 RepID=A0ABT9QT51_9ACTN|nr:ATP-binding protein [Streptosporangium lutulentum]MDP9849856.1 anti-sigma regulatory factor (Ser/Thr protein kinase) [Streptosporangium lutulentum]